MIVWMGRFVWPTNDRCESVWETCLKTLFLQFHLLAFNLVPLRASEELAHGHYLFLVIMTRLCWGPKQDAGFPCQPFLICPWNKSSESISFSEPNHKRKFFESLAAALGVVWSHNYFYLTVLRVLRDLCMSYSWMEILDPKLCWNQRNRVLSMSSLRGFWPRHAIGQTPLSPVKHD